MNERVMISANNTPMDEPFLSAEALEKINQDYADEKSKLLVAHDRQTIALQITQLEELRALAEKYDDYDLIQFYRDLLYRRKQQHSM